MCVLRFFDRFDRFDRVREAPQHFGQVEVLPVGNAGGSGIGHRSRHGSRRSDHVQRGKRCAAPEIPSVRFPRLHQDRGFDPLRCEESLDHLPIRRLARTDRRHHRLQASEAALEPPGDPRRLRQLAGQAVHRVERPDQSRSAPRQLHRRRHRVPHVQGRGPARAAFGARGQGQASQGRTGRYRPSPGNRRQGPLRTTRRRFGARRVFVRGTSCRQTAHCTGTPTAPFGSRLRHLRLHRFRVGGVSGTGPRRLVQGLRRPPAGQRKSPITAVLSAERLNDGDVKWAFG